MNRLDSSKRAQVISLLVEGNSLGSTSPLTSVAINTVVKLAADAGAARSIRMRNLQCQHLQIDEIWSFCYAKAKNVTTEIAAKNPPAAEKRYSPATVLRGASEPSMRMACDNERNPPFQASVRGGYPMDLDQLHTFLEIVRLKSFSKAAQTCFRTQPAISAQVRQLEQELNTTLFERLGTKISLTTAGKIFAEYAEQILDLRRRAQDTINELDRVPRGELVIAANEATCIYVLPLVFSEFKKKFPNVQLSVDRSYGARVVEAVLNNLADFGITQLPVQEKKLQIARIHSDEIVLLLPAKHPLATKKSVTPRELSGYQLLLPKTGTTRARLDVWLEPVEDELKISMELDSTEMIKRFVMAGLGLSFLAASHCREEVASGKLTCVSLAPEPMLRKVALIYRKDKALSKAALGFIQVILEQAKVDGPALNLSKLPAVVAT